MSCGDPGSLSNGFKIGNKFTYGESVIYDCNAGYKLQGSIIRKCGANGQWSGSAASCVGKKLQFHRVFILSSPCEHLKYLLLGKLFSDVKESCLTGK